MTTIASDGKTVAADGQCTAGNEILSTDRVKLEVCQDCVLAFSGTAALQPVAFKWFKEGADPAKVDGFLKDKDWTLAVFRQDVAEYYRNDCPHPLEVPYPTACGSGEDYAIGALMAGASPKEAIEIACVKDTMTSGKITVVEIPRKAEKLAEAAE